MSKRIVREEYAVEYDGHIELSVSVNSYSEAVDYIARAVVFSDVDPERYAVRVRNVVIEEGAWETIVALF